MHLNALTWCLAGGAPGVAAAAAYVLASLGPAAAATRLAGVKLKWG